ncbi:hypothetical protein ACFWM5_39625, partial [Streptomyces bobili]|uniref:hypothetical protein n=1 Tax=Streptomyces bobili TaxID=67280 RepID=UPI0036692C0A
MAAPADRHPQLRSAWSFWPPRWKTRVWALTQSSPPAMTAIDQLLARACLHPQPDVPDDTVPYED